jgi:acetoin utilization deacetylase AcuC-like enzyme
MRCVAKTGIYFHPDCLEHDTGPGHPERPMRLSAIASRLHASGLWSAADVRQPPPAEPADLGRVHSERYLRALPARCELAPDLLDADTSVCPASWRVARLAAGAAVEACRNVLAGTWANAFCAVRPPGHHAEHDRAMGFCLLNNVAVAAAWLLAQGGLERVAILDWDVHHGNGTQHLFEDSPRVFYASLHQWPLYPGTGAAVERGVGPGLGATLNCPMDPGSGDREWLAAFEDTVLPALDAFRPEFVLVSAGFDAHKADPLAGIELSEQGFRELSRGILELAAHTAGGRLVSLLEGGYDLGALAASVEVHVVALCDAAEARA